MSRDPDLVASIPIAKHRIVFDETMRKWHNGWDDYFVRPKPIASEPRALDARGNRHRLSARANSAIYREKYLRINLNGHVLTLDDDGFILWESVAINLYLAEKYAPAPLWPASMQDRARVYQWSPREAGSEFPDPKFLGCRGNLPHRMHRLAK